MFSIPSGKADVIILAFSVPTTFQECGHFFGAKSMSPSFKILVFPFS
tara:strand:+ start:7148 stop:7288 length:141 start_codon:yes stop_codon:yes gene_type:complete